jgi:hypothetical protein
LIWLAAMSIPADTPEDDNEPTLEMVAAILESWSVEEIRQLVEEIEAEIASTLN